MLLVAMLVQEPRTRKHFLFFAASGIQRRHGPLRDTHGHGPRPHFCMGRGTCLAHEGSRSGRCRPFGLGKRPSRPAGGAV